MSTDSIGERSQAPEKMHRRRWMQFTTTNILAVTAATAIGVKGYMEYEKYQALAGARNAWQKLLEDPISEDPIVVFDTLRTTLLFIQSELKISGEGMQYLASSEQYREVLRPHCRVILEADHPMQSDRYEMFEQQTAVEKISIIASLAEVSPDEIIPSTTDFLSLTRAITNKLHSHATRLSAHELDAEQYRKRGEIKFILNDEAEQEYYTSPLSSYDGPKVLCGQKQFVTRIESLLNNLQLDLESVHLNEQSVNEVIEPHLEDAWGYIEYRSQSGVTSSDIDLLRSFRWALEKTKTPRNSIIDDRSYMEVLLLFSRNMTADKGIEVLHSRSQLISMMLEVEAMSEQEIHRILSEPDRTQLEFRR